MYWRCFWCQSITIYKYMNNFIVYITRQETGNNYILLRAKSTQSLHIKKTLMGTLKSVHKHKKYKLITQLSLQIAVQKNWDEKLFPVSEKPTFDHDSASKCSIDAALCSLNSGFQYARRKTSTSTTTREKNIPEQCCTHLVFICTEYRMAFTAEY